MSAYPVLSQTEVEEINFPVLKREIDWFEAVLAARLEMHATGSHQPGIPETPDVPDLTDERSCYVRFIKKYDLSDEERLILILALLPHVVRHVLDPLLIQNDVTGRPFTEFGGYISREKGTFLPTGETALFLLAGLDVVARLKCQQLLLQKAKLFRQHILTQGEGGENHTELDHPLCLTPEARDLLLFGKDYDPPFSEAFPAERIETALEWEDLVLSDAIRKELDYILSWTRNEPVLMKDWGLSKSLAPGFRSLFYGPPGTGKTLTACLIGKRAQMPVFRVDVSKVISKYIGDTEKNLANLFDRARLHRWILFFDEADSLFAQRGEVGNASDRAANQNTSYLLQRIERHDGVVLLASNLPKQIDEAFSRRFQSILHFKPPNEKQRLELWKKYFYNKPYEFDKSVDIEEIVGKYELNGGEIINILRISCLKSIDKNISTIDRQNILNSIQREYEKTGKYTKI